MFKSQEIELIQKLQDCGYTTRQAMAIIRNDILRRRVLRDLKDKI